MLLGACWMEVLCVLRHCHFSCGGKTAGIGSGISRWAKMPMVLGLYLHSYLSAKACILEFCNGAEIWTYSK
uniref:Uncharacterized protein n=1 Tax=Rhizophora mucronata TaxID=61149 RepID=A0A2P2L0Z8_RHIMU